MVTPLNEDCLLPKQKKENKIGKWFKNLFKTTYSDIISVQPMSIGKIKYIETKIQQNIDNLETHFKTKYSKEYKTVLKNKIKKQSLTPTTICSQLTTPDGTKLESTSVHDYKKYIDANNKTYMIDGGLDYTRRSNHGDEKMLYITSDMPHEIIRLYAYRIGYGDPKTKNYGKQHILTRICYMSDSYLQASIDYCIKHKLINNNHFNILLDEQIYRIVNNVSNIVNLDFEVI